MAVAVRTVGAGEGEMLRRVRLRALADSPDAFAATLAEEAELPAVEWTQRAAAGAAGTEQTLFLGVDAGGEPRGMAGGRWYDEARVTVALWGMWVDPAARGSGLAARLVAAVHGWAAAGGAQRLRLGVMADSPTGAVRLYERTGFVRTGSLRPLTRDPTRMWFEMVRPVSEKQSGA